MEERLLALRRELNLTQEKFAQQLNISRTAWANIERGVRNLTDRTISDICRVFRVDEIWLRTGVGDMFRKPSEEEELAKFFNMVYNSEEDSIVRNIVKALSKLNEEDWEIFEKLLNKLFSEQKK